MKIRDLKKTKKQKEKEKKKSKELIFEEMEEKKRYITYSYSVFNVVAFFPFFFNKIGILMNMKSMHIIS